MASWRIDRRVDLRSVGTQPVGQIRAIKGEALAHVWRVTVTDGGAPANLSGCTAGAQLVRDDGTMQIAGSITGNVVSVTLPQAAYAYEGTFSAFMWIVDAASGSETVIDAVQLTAGPGSSGPAIDPGAVVPTLNQLLAQIAACEAATVAAQAIAATKGAANGVCPLDGSGFVPSAYLPVLGAALFGARWDGGTSPACTRLGDAIGAIVTSLPTPGITAFSYNMPALVTKICNIHSGSIAPVAYLGDPDFKRDGSNGNVFVEVPLCYYLRKPYGSGAGFEAWVSSKPYGGMQPHPLFVRPDGSLRSRVFVAAYQAGYDATADKLTSVSGAAVKVSQSRAWFLDKAALSNPLNGLAYTIGTAEWASYDQLAGMIEFATLDVPGTIGSGHVTLQFSASHTAVISESNVNRIVVTNAVAALYEVGQTIDVATGLGLRDIATDRVITGIISYDANNKAISFGGAPVSVAIGNVVYHCAQRTGGGDAVGGMSGHASGTDGRIAVVRRGVENPYGNVFEFMANAIRVADNRVWLCRNPARYANNLVFDGTTGGASGDGYAPLNYPLHNADGFVTAMGYDSDRPWAMFPTAIGGSSATKFCDSLYRADGEERCVLRGGYWAGQKNGGPWCWRATDALTGLSRIYGARMLILPD